MNNFLSLKYKELKEKAKATDSDYHYQVDFINALCQVVRIDDFENITGGIDYDLFQTVKLTQGVVGLTKVNGNYYCVFDVKPVGLPNNTMHYNNVIGSYYNVNNELEVKNFEVGKDIVLWYNNHLGVCENDIYKYADILSEIDTSLNVGILKTRYTDSIEVESEQDKQNYQKAIRETKNGEPVVFVRKKNALIDSESLNAMKLNDFKDSDKLQYLSHLYDDIIKRFCNKNGVSMNMSSKQAQQTEKEISGMDAYSWLNPVSMLYQCQLFCKNVMDLYGAELKCHFGIVHELNYHKYTMECTSNDTDDNVHTEDENVDTEMEKDEQEVDNIDENN